MGEDGREVLGGRIPCASSASVKIWVFTLSEMGSLCRVSGRGGAYSVLHFLLLLFFSISLARL